MVKISLSQLSIAICFVVISSLVFSEKYWRDENKVIDSDVVNYYGYLPAVFIYQDASLMYWDDLDFELQIKLWFKTNEEQERTLKMSMGVAYFYCPLFLVAHQLAGPLGYESNGYTLPYRLSIVLTSLLFYLLGLVFLRKILLNYFSELVTAITIVVIAIGTNIINYVIYEPGMSHVFSFFSIAVFLHYSIKWHKSNTSKSLFILGLITGLIILIRPTNITVLLFFLLFGVRSFSDFKNRIALFLSKYKQVIFAILGGLIIVLPQLLYWKYSTGDWFYYSYSEEGFFFNDPKILQGMFSFRNGWLIYTPLMTLALFGLFIKNEIIKNFRLSLIVFVFFHFYITFSWWCWWYGGSYGMRSLIDIYPLLSIPLAVFISYLNKWKQMYRLTILVVIVLFIGLNFFQFNQYRNTILHYDSMTYQAYKHIFLSSSVPKEYLNDLDHPDYDKAVKGDR
jgi:hypothetical protein